MAEEGAADTEADSWCAVDERPATLRQTDNIHIENLEYPWEDVEDMKPTDLEYELFCGALESFWSKPLDELVDDWTISLETLLPAIRSSIRMYSKSVSCKEKVSEMDVELARWVKFGLSSSQLTSYAENSRVVMVGCALVKQLSAMHEKQLSATFCKPDYLQYIMDIILSAQYCASVRCEAAQALLHILFHPSTSCNFMLVRINDNEYTPYEQIVRLFTKPENVPLDLLVALQKVTSYFAFKYSCNFVTECAHRCFMEKDCDADVHRLLFSLTTLQKFFVKIKNHFGYTSRMAHQTILKNRVIPHICALATLPSQSAKVRHLAVQCLATMCDFDGTDISGAVFLSHMNSGTISLVGQLLQRIPDNDKEVSLLPYALRAVVLIDQLAAANGNRVCASVTDTSEHVAVLQNILNMMSVDEARRAMVSALSFRDNLKHLLRACDIQKSLVASENNTDDDIKTRFRQTATYGYLCEILFALARNQSDGTFWRMHGPEISKLIDCNLVSAATSLKQWLEPFREELALGTDVNTLNFLSLRLDQYTEKYKEGDPPLPLVTLLRLIDAILDAPEKACLSVVPPGEIRFEYCTAFYEDNGLEKIINVLSVANDEQSRRVRDGCTSLSGDSYIYCQFVRSATSIIYKLLFSMQAVNQNPDKVVVDVLLRTYTLCCMDEACCDHTVSNIISKSFAFFIPPPSTGQQRISKSGQQSFLELFLDSGFEKPSNFLAALNVLRKLLPLPSSALMNDFKIDREEAVSMVDLWEDRILKCEKQLQFAVLLGISSSQRLRLCLFDLCKHLACLSEKIAVRIAEILMRQSLRMLTASAHGAVTEVFDDDVLEEEESNVRFGNAVDFVTASFYAFMAACSTDLSLRNAMVAFITQHKNYIATLMKFFKLASPKTAPHVMFQTHVIKIFRNLCIADLRIDGEVNYLPRDIYITLCDSLVEHFGNAEHGVETALLALKNVCDMAHSSAFGNAVINKSVTINEGAVLRFLDRFNSMSEANEKMLSEAASLLVDLFENVLRKATVRFVALKFHSSADSEEHPLLRLKNRLAELGCSEQVLLNLQNAFEYTVKAEPAGVESDDLGAYEWPENAVSMQHTINQQAANYHKSNLLNLAYQDYDDFHYTSPLPTVDLITLNEEFFSGAVLPSANVSEFQPCLQNSYPAAAKVQRWKTFASNLVKRKRSFAISKSPVVRPKIRRY